MDKIGRPAFFASMAPLFEAPGRTRLGIILAGKNENDIVSFIAKGLAIRLRILPRHPANVHAHGLVAPCSFRIERLMEEGLDHAGKLLLRPRAWPFRNQSDDPRHILAILLQSWEPVFVPGIAKVAGLREQRLGETVDEIVVQTQPQGGPA
jgi:hypothetical protein